MMEEAEPSPTTVRAEQRFVLIFFSAVCCGKPNKNNTGVML